MNYRWQTPHVDYAGSWFLDYSQAAFLDLDETNLHEAPGIGGHAGHQVPVGLPRRLVDESGPVDWDLSGTPGDATGVVADINESGTLEVLESYADWPNLYFFHNQNWVDGVHVIVAGSEADLEEMTFEIYMSNSVPPIGDLDGDGDVDLNDFALFAVCFAGATNPPAPGCAPGVDADLDDDGDVDLNDFATFGNNFTG